MKSGAYLALARVLEYSFFSLCFGNCTSTKELLYMYVLDRIAHLLWGMNQHCMLRRASWIYDWVTVGF